MGVLAGTVPSWALIAQGRYGDGTGYGYGYGYGDGDGSGFGYGYGDGDGDDYDYGAAYGDGDGSGYSLKDIHRSQPRSVLITAKHLRKACPDQVKLFKETFPNGGLWPDDMDKAIAAGLHISWAYEELGLFPLIEE